MTNIHKTAIINPSAKIGNNVEIGPFAIIGEDTVIGDGSNIAAHALIDKWTTLGKNCTVYSFAAVGTAPQDLKYKNEKSFTKIGDNTTIRESVTINRATGTNNTTTIGNNCLLMAYSHIAHDCIVKDNVIIANAGTLAGHVTIENNVILGGLAAIHQFCVIGEMALIGGCSKIVKDVTPFTIADGNPAATRSLNLIGLQRKNYAPAEIKNLKQAFKLLFKKGLNTANALEKIEETINNSKEVSKLIEFVQNSTRGITK